ncbi:MAG: reverse transcriptase family protein, partial [Candidatus Thiodiazotropha sp.]
MANKRGKGTWKLNDTLLNEDTYKKGIRSIIRETKAQNSDLKSKRLLWELVKINIKEYSITYAIERAKTRSRYVKQLENKHNSLTDETQLTSDKLEQKRELETLIDKYYEEKTRGNFIRSKAKWAEQGERSSSYFLRLENKRQSVNVIRSLKQIDKTVTSDEEILETASGYYKELYSSRFVDPNKIDHYLNNTDIPMKLTEADRNFCDNDINLSELSEIVNALTIGKSPGSDGLTAAFYKEMWNDIKHLYFEMIKETIAVGELPDTARRAIISLIHKKGDSEQLSNYRPISLTNYDYKILAFTLSKRLQNVIGKIISNDQTGYIKKRFIGCNARLVNDIITCTNEQNLPGALLFLDFEKAFDSVEWNFIFKVLEKFNFGPYFSSLIRILYNNPSFTIKNNGWLSEIQSMHRGVRQGCPVSAQLFILVVELLALNIRNAKDIKGIKLPGGMESKISQYADDSTLTLSDLDSITNCIREIKSFCAVSGLKLNINKSVGIWLGTLRGHALIYEGIQFTNDPVKCLGIYVGHNQAENYILNWTSKVKKIKDLLNSWKCRNLTIFGKCLIIKSLAISKLNLLFSVL